MGHPRPGDHLTQGYSLNEHRLAQQGLSELEHAVKVLGQTLTRQALVSDVGQEVVNLILGYARTWRLLQDFDEGLLGLPPGSMNKWPMTPLRCSINWALIVAHISSAGVMAR